MPQPQPRQQLGLKDIQMLQQHVMIKQLQELQRYQKVQEFRDGRQQNYINQLSPMNKHVSGNQCFPLVNGTPIQDASQMFAIGNMNMVQGGALPALEELPNGFVYSQSQDQDPRSTSLVPQLFDASLLGNPIANVMNSFSQYSHLQGFSDDVANGLTNCSSSQVGKPTVQSTGSNPFLGNHFKVSSDQHYIADGAFVPKQVLKGEILFPQVPAQVFDCGVLPENPQQMNSLQRNASVFQSSERQEQAGWPSLIPVKPTQNGPSQGLTALDPLEQKILFNREDSSWHASFGRGMPFGRRNDVGTGGCRSNFEQSDDMSSFPSLQSGSWSALMQSAVAEASSSDTGLQEEWSGMSLQNTEISTDNQPSSFVDGGKQQIGWADISMPNSSSLSSKPQLLFHDSTMNATFPVFQQSNIQFSVKHSDSSLESAQQFLKDSVKPSDYNTQQKLHFEESQQVETISQLQYSWSGQSCEHPKIGAHEQHTSSYNSSQTCKNEVNGGIESPSCGENATPSIYKNEDAVTKSWVGDIGGALCKEKDPDCCGWKSEENCAQHSFSYSLGGLNELNAGLSNTMIEAEDSRLRNTAAAPDLSMAKADKVTSQHVLLSHQLDKVKHIDVFVKHNQNESMNRDHWRLGNSLQDLPNPCGRAGETYQKQGNCYQKDNFGDEYLSNTSQHTARENKVNENVWLHNKSDSQPMAGENQKSSFQVSLGLNSHEQAIFRQFNHLGHNSSGLGKEHLPDNQKNLTEMEPASFDKAVGIHGQLLTAQTRQDMVERGQQVNCSRDQSSVSHFSSAESNPSLKFPGVENTWASMANPHEIPQYFGLRLAPPTQSLANANSLFPTHGSPQMGNYTTSQLPAPLGPKNLLQKQDLSAEFSATQYPQSVAGRTSTEAALTRATSEDASHAVSIKPVSEQFAILESLPVNPSSSVSGLPQQVEFLTSTANGSGILMGPPKKHGVDGAQRRANNSSAVSPRNLEPFGCPPSSDQKYSLLRQMQFLKNPETDPSKRFFGKNSRVDSHTNVQQIPFAEHHKMYRDKSGAVDPSNNELHDASQVNSLLNRDVKILSLSSERKEDRPVPGSSQPLNQDTLHMISTHGQSGSQGHSNCNRMAFDQTGDSLVSLQMAPSWLDHYGTFKNGQMLPMYEARAVKSSAQQLPLLKYMNTSMIHTKVAESSKDSSGWPTTTTIDVVKPVAPSMLPSDKCNQNMIVRRLKKRKIATSRLLPWHKEVEQGSTRLHNISMIQREWAHVTNLLAEKVEDETEMVEDMQQSLRPKKRLILTTQLMQQVLRPAQASALSSDASSNYDSVVYLTAKLALGDACSLTSCRNSDSCVSSNAYEMICKKNESPQRISEDCFSKVVETFAIQAKKLESDLLRLDKTASITDINVEFQELEKFSIINRFARFHCRGQSDPAATSSSTGTTPTMMKPPPQRYVIAFPMPRAVPEGAQCLSL